MLAWWRRIIVALGIGGASYLIMLAFMILAVVYDKELEEDAWEPFVNLMKTTKFVDFEIYQAFKSLHPKQMDQLGRKSERRSNELISQENANELIGALEEMAASYQKEKEALDYDYKDFVNGEELYHFYKEIMIKVQEMLRQLKS